MARSSSKSQRKTSKRKKESRGIKVTAVLLVIIFASATLLVLYLTQDEHGLQWLSSKFKGEEPVAPELLTLQVERAAREALTDLGIAEEQLSVEGGDADGAGSGPEVWEAPLPPGVTLEKANVAVTSAVEGASGRIVDGWEWRAKRKRRRCLTLIAATDSAQCLELRLYETSGAHKGKSRSPAKLALVVGRLGQELNDIAKRYIESPLTITLAVLPGRPASEKTARLAKAHGKEVLLHLPMEPTGYPKRDPGEGALLLDHSAREIRRMLRSHLKDLGCVSGVVNYMGSAGTRDRDLMRAALGEIKDDGLFFVDSSASAHSVAAEIAAGLGLPCLVNDLFLEGGDNGSGLLKKRLDRAERIALQKGKALVLARPTPDLLDVLTSRAADYESRGILLVTASGLLED